jgi:hypothetical protein
VTGITIWDELGRLSGRTLVVLNNRDVGDPAAGALWDALTQHVDSGSLSVVADRAWSAWIDERGLAETSVRLCVDRFGAPLEINYFLEQPETVRWVAESGVETIAGSSPHSLYNEEVQHVFERRAAFLIGRTGRLLAHTLPNRYLYLFARPDLIERMGRHEKVAAYQATAHGLVDDLHRLWRTQGTPRTADGSTSADVRQLMAAHLGEAVLDYDEESPIPILRPSPSTAVADFVEELRNAYLRLADQHAGHTAAIAIREDARNLLRRLRGTRT